MRGDQEDFVRRLRLTLPAGWFSDEPRLLNGVLAGFASVWAWLHELLAEVRKQSRVQTATGQFLDLACVDFFGGRLPRRAGESDAALRFRVARAMRRERGTRAGLIAAAAEAGYAARVFEPARPADTGAYNRSSTLAYGLAGAWGSLEMPLECLVTVQAIAPVEPIGPALAAVVAAGGVAWVRER